MSQSEREIEPGSAVQSALQELQGMIAQRYPSAAFAISRGDDPEGFYLTPTVDVEDTTEVYDVVRAAQQAGFEAVGAGVPAQRVDRAARRVIDEAGYGAAFFHRIAFRSSTQ